MSFTVAIIGRPNVGKSTLFNRLAGKRLALVDDQPGLTRDRRDVTVALGAAQPIRLVDTAGMETGDDTLLSEMRRQTETAIAQADLVLFLIDARAGLLPADEGFADLVRRSGKPVLLAANKCEGRAAEPGLYDAYGLGFGDPLPLSAEHGLGIGELIEAIEKAAQAEDEARAAQSDEEERRLQIAVVGRPNVGKSTLTNALLGEERMITGAEAGITRDAIASELSWQGRPIRLFDTAGLRRKMKVEGRAESLSVGDTLNAIRFAETVILLIDAERPFEKQDLVIADLIVREGRGLVIALNKWDLIKDKRERLKELDEMCTRLLPQIKGVALVPISSLKRQGMDRLMTAVIETDRVWNQRLPTHALNQWLGEMVEAHAPPQAAGRRIKLRYMTQVSARPPSFVVFCSQPKALPDSYLRYLSNGLRTAFDLPGVPIRLALRKGANPYVRGGKP